MTQIAAVPLPVTPPVGKTSLSSLTAGRLLVDVLAAGINAELGDAFRASVAGTPLDLSNAVEFTAATEPTEEFVQTTTVKWPALFVYYSTEDADEDEAFTTRQNKVKQTWVVEYILGPLMPDSRERLESAIIMARLITSTICRQGGHIAYGVDPSGGGPAQVFDAAGYYKLTCGKMQGFGAASFGGGAVKYLGGRWSVGLTLYVGLGDGETDPGFNPLQGATLDVDLGAVALDGTAEAPVDDFLVAQLEVGP